MHEAAPYQFCFYALIGTIVILSPPRSSRLDKAIPYILFVLAALVMVCLPLGATLLHWPVVPEPFIILSFFFAIWGWRSKRLPA